MRHYSITWTVDTEADSPKQAARYAVAYFTGQADSSDILLRVTDDNGKETMVETNILGDEAEDDEA